MKNKMQIERRHFWRQFWSALIIVTQLILPSCNANTLSDDYYNKNFDVANMFGSPLITPIESNITLDVGTNYTLTCESSESITWRVPENSELSIVYDISSFKNNGQIRPFASHLKLFNVGAHNVGDYYCLNSEFQTSEDLEDLIIKFKATKIYVFVNDPVNLIVPNIHPVITAYQYADVVIPCKPTSEAVTVELVSMEDESQHFDSTNRYDPTIGFIVKIMHISDGGTYICRPKDRTDLNSQNQILFALMVLTDSIQEFINKPSILSNSGSHASQSEQISLVCSIEVRVGVIFSINWILPNDNIAQKEGRVYITDTTRESHVTTNDAFEIGKSQLIVQNVDREKDSGYYKCEVADHSNNRNSESKLITILNHHESYINISEPTGHYKVVTSTKKSQTQLFARYRGYPLPIELTWYDNQGRQIIQSPENNKYNVERTEHDILLRIKNIELRDTGDYFLKAFNRHVEKELKFTLVVKEKPSVSTENVYVQVGKEAKLTCECAGYPESVITWVFTPCKIRPKWPTCTPTRSIDFQINEFTTSPVTSLLQKSELIFKPSEPGIAECIARNTEGNDSIEANVFLGDLNEPFEAYIENTNKVVVGDRVIMVCGALAYNYSAEITWYRDNIPVRSDHQTIELRPEQTEYSYRTLLIFNNVEHKHAGTYECRANLISDYSEPETTLINLNVYDPQEPIIEFTNLEGTAMNKNLGELLRLECKFSGIPEPTIEWYKDNEIIDSNSNESRFRLEENGSVLHNPYIKPEDEGLYKCLVENRVGKSEKNVQIKIADMPGLKLIYILLIIGGILVLAIVSIALAIGIFRQRKQLKEMKAAGLQNFEEGAVECINPALSLDEQADLLPYDRRFEFPKEKLKLGKQLGAGAFGVVLKATAEGILPDEKETTVAVKMVKKTADNEVMKALVSELKIMVHLGQHLNVVNLLGAITKNIAKREVMVIVEFCRYGNVQNFLLKNRKRFINQINSDTDQIDSSITARDQSGHPNSKGYIRQSDLDYIGGSNMDSCNTEQTLISTIHEGEDGTVLSNNSIQPAWRSNYKPDCTDAMDINTTHLLSWAFQVARGMDYLASRKVLHGDLAARNILLCDDNVVKICDFGLARSMYKNDNYKKQGEAPLPIKWLALESLGDQVFSTNSDIWSYGIVLWEFFSLAKVPYPGMEADQSLYLKLKDGYRMEKPQFANQELYEIMLECWSANPEARPPFVELERRFSKMLEDDVTNHYIDLNEPYLRINSQYYRQGQTDYLALMGVPEESAPQAPRYVNSNLAPEIRIGDNPHGDYLHMSPKSGDVIFSPRPDDNYVRADQFNFQQPNSPTISNNLDNALSKNRKKAGIPEEIPMLKQNNSDSEAELSPDPESGKRQFSNLNSQSNDYNNKIVVGNDNYVNLQADPIRKAATKDAFSNPGYQMLTTVNETRK